MGPGTSRMDCSTWVSMIRSGGVGVSNLGESRERFRSDSTTISPTIAFLREIFLAGTVADMRRNPKLVTALGLTILLSSCQLFNSNNDAAEAACIGQRGTWYRDDQRCVYPLTDRERTVLEDMLGG